MKRLWIFLALVALIAACSPNPTDTPVSSDQPNGNSSSGQLSFVPEPADISLTRGEVIINSTDLLVMESFPPQFMLSLKGNLPTPCHHMRAAVDPPDADNKIMVDVYTVSNPDMMCAQVLQPFSETIELGTFPGGHYSVWVNGQLAGEFDS
jgi:hypothetical protein